MTPLYTYREDSRRLAVSLAFALSSIMLAAAFVYGAPWFFYIPVGMASAMSGWMLVFNRISGADLSVTQLMLYANTWQKVIQVKDVAEVKITTWSDGAPSLALLMKDGTRETIPAYCVGTPLAFADEIAKLGVIATKN